MIASLQTFAVSDAQCRSDFDREFIQNAICAWYGSEKAFEDFVRHSLREELMGIACTSRIPLHYIPLVAAPVVASTFDCITSMVIGQAPTEVVLTHFLGFSLAQSFFWFFPSLSLIIYLVWSLGLSSSRRLGPCDDISHFLSVLCHLCGRPDHHQPCMFSQLLDHSGLVYFHNLCDCLFGTQAQLCRKKPGNWESGGQSLKVWSFTPWRIGCFVGSFAKAFKTSCKCMMTCHQLAAVSMQTWNQLEPAPLNVCILQSSKGSKSSSSMPAHQNDASYLDPYTVDAPHDAPHAFGSSYQYPQDKKWWYGIIWYSYDILRLGSLQPCCCSLAVGIGPHEAGGLGLYGVVLRNLLPDHFGRKLEWNKKFQKVSQKSLNVL